MIWYSTSTWPAGSAFVMRVVDSYGPGQKAVMPFYVIAALGSVLWLLVWGRVDVLHVNLSHRLSVLRKGMFVFVGNLFRVPVIIHMHGSQFIPYVTAVGPRRRRWITGLLRRASRVLVLGSYARNFLIEKMEVDAAKIIVASNAVPDVGRMGDRDNPCCSLLFLGQVGERKGMSVLLKALAGPQMSCLPWEIVIAGDGALAPYRKMVRKLGLTGRVKFAGLLSNEQTDAALWRADVLVLPSRNEGLPMAILEAFAHTCPVVATPVGSITEAVIDNETGLIVPVDDHRALDAALSRLVGDAALRGRLGRQARRIFEAKFTIAPYNRDLEVLYLELTRQARATVGPCGWT